MFASGREEVVEKFLLALIESQVWLCPLDGYVEEMNE